MMMVHLGENATAETSVVGMTTMTELTDELNELTSSHVGNRQIYFYCLTHTILYLREFAKWNYYNILRSFHWLLVI